MKQLKLVLPTSADEQEVWGYRKEFLEQGSSLDGSGGLAEAESFAQWYSKTLANRSEQTVCPGLVPATTFLAVDADGKLIGMIDIRHRLKDHPEKRRCFRKRGGRKRERRGPHHPALLDYPVIRREKTGLRPFGSSPVFFTCADACAAPARCPDRRTSQDRQDR